VLRIRYTKSGKKIIPDPGPCKKRPESGSSSATLMYCTRIINLYVELCGKKNIYSMYPQREKFLKTLLCWYITSQLYWYFLQKNNGTHFRIQNSKIFQVDLERKKRYSNKIRVSLFLDVLCGNRQLCRSPYSKKFT
jgi:hypothetical protein